MFAKGYRDEHPKPHAGKWRKVEICLITAHHVSFQPRTLREADELSAAGHEVRVICRQTDPGLVEYDDLLMRTRPWEMEKVQLLRNGDSHKDWLNEALRTQAFKGLFKLGSRTPAVAVQSYVRGLRPAIRLACTKKADWFIAHTQAALPVAAAAAKKWNARLGFDCEDLLAELGGDPPDVVRLIEKEYLPLCDYVSVPSASISMRLLEQYRIKEPVVLYNVFPSKLAAGMVPPIERRGAAVLKLHWFGQTIGEGRGLEGAIVAANLVRGEVELHLRGRVTPEYQERLESLARAGDSHMKLFFHPVLIHDELIRSMDQFDVGLALENPDNPGYARTVTNKFFSYLLAGLAVAATTTPGQKEVLNQIPDAGFLFPAGQPQLLAAGLQRWLDDRQALRATQQSAWDSARTRFCWDVEKRRFLSLFEAQTLAAVSLQ